MGKREKIQVNQRQAHEHICHHKTEVANTQSEKVPSYRFARRRKSGQEASASYPLSIATHMTGALF